MRMVTRSSKGIKFGKFQDAEELFRKIFFHFPPEAAESIGIKYIQVTSNAEGNYIFSTEAEKIEPLLMINLPGNSKSYSLSQLVHDCIFLGEMREMKIHHDDHEEYFAHHGLEGQVTSVIGYATKTITRYSDFLPIFLVRMDQDERPLHVEIKVNTVLRICGAPFDYFLVSFAVFHSKHYYSYALSNVDQQWYLHNDSQVTQVCPDSEAFLQDLEKRATCLFYARAPTFDEPEIPPILQFYAWEANKLQHLSDYIKNLE